MKATRPITSVAQTLLSERKKQFKCYCLSLPSVKTFELALFLPVLGGHASQEKYNINRRGQYQNCDYR